MRSLFWSICRQIFVAQTKIAKFVKSTKKGQWPLGTKALLIWGPTINVRWVFNSVTCCVTCKYINLGWITYILNHLVIIKDDDDDGDGVGFYSCSGAGTD